MINSSKSDWYSYLLITVIGLIVFVPFIGNVHLFDWDEANFAEAAREMLLTNNWMQVQIDFQPFWEKPPLFIWLQALSMKFFGINEFAARLPNAIAGVVSLCTLYYIGKQVSKKNFAWWWVLIYAGTWLPHFYFKSGIIDPIFNLFIFLAFFQFWKLINYGHNKASWLAGVFLGLAVLTKGPAAILIAGLCLFFYWLIYNQWKRVSILSLIYVGVACLFTTFIWFGIDIIQNGWWFTQTFIEYQIRLFTTQDAGHGGPFFYHFVVLLIGCFPASIFLFQNNFFKKKNLFIYEDFNVEFSRWMQLMLWVTLFLFSIVKTKIVHYSSLCYLPLSYLAARELYLISEGKVMLKKGVKIGLGIIGSLLGIAFTLLPIVGINIEMLIPYIQDEFTKANLQANVEWSYWEIVLGLVYLIVLYFLIIKMRHKTSYRLVQLFAVQIIFIELLVAHFVPKVEPYSQGAAIEYFKSIDPEKEVVYPGSYKSYAYLFYSKKMPANSDSVSNHLSKVMDNDSKYVLFFVTRIMDRKKQEDAFPNQLEFIKEKNGYILYKYIKK